MKSCVTDDSYLFPSLYVLINYDLANQRPIVFLVARPPLLSVEG